MGPPRPDPWTLTAFGVVVLLGGMNAVAVRFTNFELPPAGGAGARFLLAGAVFAAAMLALGRSWPRGTALRGAVLFGVLTFGCGYALVYWALVHVKAGLTMVLLSTVPLLTLLLAGAHGVEAFRWRGLAGALVAAAGVAVVFHGQVDAGAPWVAIAAVLGGALCWSEASVLLKRFPGAHPAAVNAIGMLLGAVLLLGLSAALGEPRPQPTRGTTWMAFAYLVVGGSLVMFLLSVVVLQRWTASAASYQFLLYPLVSLSASAWLDGERLTLALGAGSALVLAGVYLGAFGRAPARSPGAGRT